MPETMHTAPPVRSVSDVLADHECSDPLTGATNFESWSMGTVTF